jgi:hypothetical protein
MVETNVPTRRPLGATLIAGICLAAGLAGIIAFWGAVPRTSNTSPLMALLALLWGCTYILTSILIWRRSRFAALAFLAAIALLLFPASLIIPGGRLFAPSFVVVTVVAFFGVRYLRKIRQPA